jgi:hydrophobic/amphiphilic exporter-1 (mainly G- bacteria), HAE1 family
MLIGIVVTNAIVLIERVQQQIEHGLTIREALIEAGGTRLRPILMTAIATICALTPLAIGLGGGSIISSGLAVVVIGGLASSTLLTLVVVPVMYELLYFKRSRKQRTVQTLLQSEIAA